MYSKTSIYRASRGKRKMHGISRYVLHANTAKHAIWGQGRDLNAIFWANICGTACPKDAMLKYAVKMRQNNRIMQRLCSENLYIFLYRLSVIAWQGVSTPPEYFDCE